MAKIAIVSRPLQRDEKTAVTLDFAIKGRCRG
jgi:hypothetical protein